MLCGCLDHIDRDCDLVNEDDVIASLPLAYRSWLRAPPRKPATVTAEGKPQFRALVGKEILRKGEVKTNEPTIFEVEGELQWIDEV